MSTPPELATVAVFGGTGGCAFGALLRAVEAGHKVRALARTPAKLNDQLLKRDVSQSTIDANLQIIQGNVTNQDDVSKTVLVSSGVLVDVIISGIGAAPVVQWSLTAPFVADQPTLCGDAVRCILDSVNALQRDGKASKTKKPFIATVSTTGISKRGRDVPLALTALYHWLLASVHVDKEKMEVQLETRCALNDPASPVAGFASVRASLLMDGQAKEPRVGWEWAGSEAPAEDQEKAPGPAIGYTISRDSVGAWMFKELVASDSRSQWAGKMVSLTG